MTDPPAPAQSPFCRSVKSIAFTMAEHDTLLEFRRKLRRRAIWTVVGSEHPEFLETVEVYLPYRIPGEAAPSWTLWRSEAGVWLIDKDFGLIEGPVSLAEALEIIQAILKTEMLKAVRAIPLAVRPRLLCNLWRHK